MSTSLQRISPALPVPPRIHSPCDLAQALMKLQRAAQLITSTLDLEALLHRVVNDLAAAVGCVEVAVWLRDDKNGDMVLRGVRGCNLHGTGTRLKVGCEGMVGHVAATGRMRYAPDVLMDPYYIPCEPDIRAEVDIPLTTNGAVIGVLSVNHREADAFSEDQLQILLALAGHIAVAVENARLFQRERQERQRMLQEADEARAFQRALFDKAVPLGSRFRVRNCKFVTMIYGVLDANSREITLASAGHPRPLLVNHQCSFLEMDAGLPLGLRVSTYPDYSVKLQPGTHLLLYTDGITEAMDVNYLEYGPERLIGHFLQPDACVEGLMQEIRCFGSQSDLTDDATAMLIRSR